MQTKTEKIKGIDREREREGGGRNVRRERKTEKTKVDGLIVVVQPHIVQNLNKFIISLCSGCAWLLCVVALIVIALNSLLINLLLSC